MTATNRPSVLLGGVGGDCHSVGLTILRHSLASNGYEVHSLGTQNRIEDFFDLAELFNVMMVSSMDGHSRYYLADFPALWARQGADRPLWYVGGNLSLGSPTATVRQYREMHFDRVFPKFTDIETVLEVLARDLHTVTPRPGARALLAPRIEAPLSITNVDEARLDIPTFRTARQTVLEQWRTGADAARLDENAAFLAAQPSFPARQQAVNQRRGVILVQPRAGVALVEDQIDIFHALKRAGASVLSYQVDSLTRLNEYAKVDLAIRDSRAARSSTLNGFPVVSHGVPALRRLIAATQVPLQTRHSARDARLLAEISYAGGVTAFEGGAITYNIPYYKDYPLADSLACWRYVDRLTGLYFERFGIALDREFFGTLTGTLIPPSLAIVVDLLEAVLAVRQGVKCVSLGYAEQGHRVQDVAAIRTLRRLAIATLHALGHKDVQVNTVFHQYMAAFPADRSLAEALIYQSAATAALSGATRVLTKTPVEALSVPAVQDNVHALGLVRAGLAAARAEVLDEPAIAREAAIIEQESRAILDRVILSGSGGVAQGIVTAFRKGLIDVPFSPSIHNAGAVLTARDTEGAVRFLSFGALPFDAELRDFHRDKMDERRRAEGILHHAHSYRLVEKDVMQIARGEFAGWPLSDPRPTTPTLARA